LYYINTGYQSVLLAVGALLAVRKFLATWTFDVLAANDWFARQSNDRRRIRHTSTVIVEGRKEDERLDSAGTKVSAKQTQNLSPPS
jgi:hypothetical protein